MMYIMIDSDDFWKRIYPKLFNYNYLYYTYQVVCTGGRIVNNKIK